MARSRTLLKTHRPPPNSGCVYSLGWWLGRAIILFFIVSIGVTLLYKVVPPPVTVTMLVDPHGFTKDWQSLSQIDRNMVAAVIAGEDAKFCEHSGFDAAAIENAMERNAKGGRLRGGSTISQQTAKNVFLWQGTGWTRYLRIMEVYLNVAETGIGTYGAEAGAQRYFRHSAARLSRIEAARIAAALPNPKKREVVAPAGFTRRHGNAIAARSGVVRRSDMDECIYQ
jgi:monofunctional glycosyltransferase